MGTITHYYNRTRAREDWKKMRPPSAYSLETLTFANKALTSRILVTELRIIVPVKDSLPARKYSGTR